MSSTNYLALYPHPLEALFCPRSVAVIGAKDTPGTVGGTIMSNLIEGGLTSTLYPINPNRESVCGRKCYPTIKDVPGDVDLTLLVIPAHSVLEVVQECVQKRVKTCVIISAGFKEIGPEGKKLEDAVVSVAKSGSMRLVGPNCLGIMNPYFSLNGSFARGMPKKGSIAFISQSGALCSAVLDWSFKENIGFSSFVSVGSMADVDWSDLIEYFGRDPHTKSILMYMETVGSVRSFLSQARIVAQEKPIIVIRPGKSQEAAKAALSHTGALSGSDDVFEAACERVGILRVSTIEQLFSMTGVLSSQPLPKGPNLAIVTNAGGPSVLATDGAVINGAKIAVLKEDTIKKLSKELPPAWSKANPVDILGDASPDRFKKATELVMDDANVDGALVIVTPQDMTDPTEVAKKIGQVASSCKKPLFGSWMGGNSVEMGRQILAAHSIPCFSYPDEAAQTFATMWRYSKSLDNLYKTPRSESLLSAPIIQREEKAREVLLSYKKQNHKILSEYESKDILKRWDIPVVETKRAGTKEEAVSIARSIGFPVVLKIDSHIVTHKSDVQGVQLNLTSEKEVEEAFDRIKNGVLSCYQKEAFSGVTVQPMNTKSGVELILGSTTDPQFGPVVLFGAGGYFVEIFQDTAIGLPPFNSTHAHNMIEKTKIARALQSFRGRRTCDLEQLERVLVHFSEMVVELPEIQECDINPLLACEDGLLALDARIVFHEAPFPQTAFRPYPIQYVEFSSLRDKTDIILRPIRSEDEPLLIRFHSELSKQTARFQYREYPAISEKEQHSLLQRFCLGDFDREIILICEYKRYSDRAIAGIVRLTQMPGTVIWDLKLIVKDSFQKKGLGSQLLEKLLRVAKAENVKTIVANVAKENTTMLSLLSKYGFSLDKNPAFFPHEGRMEGVFCMAKSL